MLCLCQMYVAIHKRKKSKLRGGGIDSILSFLLLLHLRTHLLADLARFHFLNQFSVMLDSIFECEEGTCMYVHVYTYDM